MSSHPGTSTSSLPHFSIQHPIPWGSITAGQITPTVDALLETAEKDLQAIRDLDPGSASFAQTFLALDRITDLVGNTWGIVETLHSVADAPDLRAAYGENLPKITDFFSSLTLDQSLWEVLRTTEERLRAELHPLQFRLAEETRQDFIDGGADLPPEQREAIRDLQKELATTTQKFSDNVLDATNEWEWIIDDADLLAGTPTMALESMRQDASDRGHGTPNRPAWRVNLQAPTLQPILQHCTVRPTRETIWRAAQGIGIGERFENRGHIARILQLRREKARLLGYPDFAELVLHRRMAKSASQVANFIEELRLKVSQPFLTEFRKLQTFKSESTGEPLEDFFPWDAAFWAERYSEAHLDFSSDLLRPYFPHTSVIPGLFSICERLFGISIKQLQTEVAERPEIVWDPSVSLYLIADSSGQPLGYFYADWFPRDNKRAGAWMSPLISRKPAQGILPVGLIAGNLTRPSPGKPALLSHQDVQTIFHEFGHLLHHLLSEVPYAGLAGTNVPWDFVELPSQILENWCWERESLDLFAHHWETGEKIPEQLFQKMLEARSFLVASAYMRQLAFAHLDLEMHLATPPTGPEEVDRLAEAAVREYQAPFALRPRPIHPRFSHLFSSPTGYAAGYYSYKWAEVLEADAFSRFKQEGILNPNTGAHFRASILARGNSTDPMVSFRDFVGRDPDPSALLRRDGLA
ncbi:MAG: M3 family metallopeptidase [Puniceicoccaceae bacterium]